VLLRNDIPIDLCAFCTVLLFRVYAMREI